MNFRHLNLIVIVLVLFTQVSWGSVKIEHWQTHQGGRVYYVRTQGLPMADIHVVFDAGSARDGQSFGLANLTSALLSEGAGSWSADQIAQRFESVGAIFGAGVSMDMATVTLRTLTDKPLFDKAVDTLQVMLTNPRFNNGDFLREKNRTLASIKQAEESPAEVADIAFYRALYGKHPYGHPVDGDLKTVLALKSSDLRNFYKKHYVVANAQVVIVGDLDRAQAENTAEKLLSGLPVGEKLPVLPDVLPLAQGSRQDINFPSAQTHVLVGLPSTYRQDPDYFNLYVGNHILGGSGLVSKLFKEVREERGLAYSASSTLLPLLKPGPFWISLQTRNDQTTKAMQVLNQTLTEFIAKGPTSAELEAAKKNITGGFAMRIDTNKKLASYIDMMGFYGLPLDYLDNFGQKIEQVTVNSVAEALRRRINLSLLQTVTVGNRAK